MFKRKRQRENNMLVPAFIKTTIRPKHINDFRQEAYEMWLPIFQKQARVFARGEPELNYGEERCFRLISPKGDVIPLSWLEINVLEEYMADFIARRKAEQSCQNHTNE